MESLGRSLVVYYSLSGNTERVAQDVARRLGADFEPIVERKRRVGWLGYLSAAIQASRKKSIPINPPRKRPSEYAVTIIGTPVWVGNMTPAVRAYLEQAKRQLNDVALFVTSGNTDVERILPSIESLLGRHVVAYAGFDAQELRDDEVYSRKLNHFIAAIKDRSVATEMRAVVI